MATVAAAVTSTTTIIDTATTTTDTDTATATTTTTTSVKKMAALIRHGSFANAFRSTSAILAANTTTARHDVARHKSKTSKKNKSVAKVGQRIDSAGKSLAARGFLRSQKAYEPPEDVVERIDKICEGQAISTQDDTKLEDLVVRFKLFVACEGEFKHSIPNSTLHTIETIEDLKLFYTTPVDVKTPYEALSRIELPKNLHIQQEYHRFHPDTDTLFNGMTAFPKSSTLVTGLKYKKKYPGHKQENPWLDEQMKI